MFIYRSGSSTIFFTLSWILLPDVHTMTCRNTQCFRGCWPIIHPKNWIWTIRKCSETCLGPLVWWTRTTRPTCRRSTKILRIRTESLGNFITAHIIPTQPVYFIIWFGSNRSHRYILSFKVEGRYHFIIDTCIGALHVNVKYAETC